MTYPAVEYYRTRTDLNAAFKEGKITQSTLYAVRETRVVYTLDRTKRGFTEIGEYGVFPGERLFQLKATYGLPMEDAVMEIRNKGMTINWAGFVDEARKNQWWDFQTLEVIEQTLTDTLYDRHDIQKILYGVKCHMAKDFDGVLRSGPAEPLNPAHF